MHAADLEDVAEIGVEDQLEREVAGRIVKARERQHVRQSALVERNFPIQMQRVAWRCQLTRGPVQIGVRERHADPIVAVRDLRAEQQRSLAVHAQLQPAQVASAGVVETQLALEVRGKVSVTITDVKRLSLLEHELRQGGRLRRCLNVKIGDRDVVLHAFTHRGDRHRACSSPASGHAYRSDRPAD